MKEPLEENGPEALLQLSTNWFRFWEEACTFRQLLTACGTLRFIGCSTTGGRIALVRNLHFDVSQDYVLIITRLHSINFRFLLHLYREQPLP